MTSLQDSPRFKEQKEIILKSISEWFELNDTGKRYISSYLEHLYQLERCELKSFDNENPAHLAWFTVYNASLGELPDQHLLKRFVEEAFNWYGSHAKQQLDKYCCKAGGCIALVVVNGIICAALAGIGYTFCF